jgi:PAS domain S-box-containing protein
MQYTAFLVLAPLSAVVSIGVIVYARRHYKSPEVQALTWLIFATSGWLIFNTLELASPSPGMTIFWTKVSYAFIISTPVAWLAFTLQYTGKQRWLTAPRFIWFCIIPSVTMILVLTNHLHGLIWQHYDFITVSTGMAMQVSHYGFWFWVHISYGYILVLLGALLIGKQYLKSFQLYRRQSTWLVLGALSPIAVNIIYVFHLIPGLRKDYTSVSFAFGGIAFAIGIFRYHLFDLKPVARDVVIDNMEDAMLTVDAKNRVVDLNPAAQHIAGVASETMIGRPLERTLRAWRPLIEYLQGSSHTQADIGLNGRYYDLRISPLTDRRGHLAGRLIVLRDITARKDMEKSLREHAVELEARNEELDAFAHTVAHDLKIPLTSLIGYSHFLRRRYGNVLPEEAHHYLDIIKQNGLKMTNIIDELLLLASVHVEDIRIVPLDMRTIVAEAQRRLTDAIAETQTQFIIPEAWPTAWGYAAWVEEVWVNYISNALKYGGRMDEGISPRVELGFDEDYEIETHKNVHNGENSLKSSSSETEPFIRFWVRDNGPGIPTTERSQLFGKFKRLDQVQTQGHGLGLSIVRHIVHKLRGDVGVESEMGEGSLFWFTLPKFK